jgi:Family of unknown function (DUF6083)
VISLTTCRDCGSPTAVMPLTTGGSVALDPDPVPAATAAHSTAYAVLRDATAKPLGDCLRPPAECLVRHRCPQMREHPHWTELMAVTSDDLGEWEAQALRYAYPETQAPAQAPRRLA